MAYAGEHRGRGKKLKKIEKKKKITGHKQLSSGEKHLPLWRPEPATDRLSRLGHDRNNSHGQALQGRFNGAGAEWTLTVSKGLGTMARGSWPHSLDRGGFRFPGPAQVPWAGSHTHARSDTLGQGGSSQAGCSPSDPIDRTAPDTPVPC